MPKKRVRPQKPKNMAHRATYYDAVNDGHTASSPIRGPRFDRNEFRNNAQKGVWDR